MGEQAILWFGMAGGAVALALSLLHSRYVQRSPRALQSRGSFTLFALFMLIFAVGAVVAGVFAVERGR